jgi:hypothetical protein
MPGDRRNGTGPPRPGGRSDRDMAIAATVNGETSMPRRASRPTNRRRLGLTKQGVQKVDAANRPRKREGKRNKIHVSLFVDGEDVTLIDEFNTPAEAIAACREFLDEHAPRTS